VTGAFHLLRKAAGENVSRETFDDLTLFEQKFRAWNNRINLVAASTLDDLWMRHIIDSAQLFGLASQARTWLDLGSGGGFPGLVLAFLLKRTGGNIHLVESNRKKAGFLQSAVGEFDLPAHVHAVRIEDAVGRVTQPEIVTARALANLDQLLGMAAPWLNAGARALFHKGRDYRAEIEESALHWRFDLIEHRSVVDEESVILEIGALEQNRASH
jgi:16S rRNA (guanine527-N7)-methyltransferase